MLMMHRRFLPVSCFFLFTSFLFVNSVTSYNQLFSVQVIELRNMDAPYLLPEHIFRDKCP